MINNLIGQTFGRLTVLGRSSYKHPKGKVFWDCKCSCGNISRVVSWNLTSGTTSSCGCLQKDAVSKSSTSRREDLTGRRFYRLMVLEFVETTKYNQIMWKCQCDCGNILNVRGGDLRNGRTRTCGCRGLSLGESSFNATYQSYKKAASTRELEFLLSKEQFKNITQQDCYYCGTHPSNERKVSTSTGSFIYNGIDRVDNSRGYSIDNCVPCCDMCNKSKNKHSIDEFYEWIDRVYNHLHKDVSILGSESVLARDWSSPEDNEAWAYLSVGT